MNPASPGAIRLGAPRLDRFLGGGLGRAALHDIRAGAARDAAAAAGFLMALIARSGADRRDGSAPLIWIRTVDAGRETGDLHAPGLAALGLDPARLVRVDAKKADEALWAFEAALACPGVGFVVCELWRGADRIDLTASRRAALRARQSGVTGFVLRVSGAGVEEGAAPSAAETRWRVAPAPSGAIGLMGGLAAFAGGVGRSAWRLTLERNRNGRTGSFTVEWNAHERRFIERRAAGQPRERPEHHEPGQAGQAAHGAFGLAYPEPVAEAAFDRPAHSVGVHAC